MKSRTKPSETKKNPTSSPAKTIDAGLQVEPQKGSGPSLPGTALDLDVHQSRMVAFLRERLGGTSDEVLEFLVTAGLYAIQLDELAEGRVADGLGRIFVETDIATEVMNGLRDIECNQKNDVLEFIARTWRPRMIGDWRGVAAGAGA